MIGFRIGIFNFCVLKYINVFSNILSIYLDKNYLNVKIKGKKGDLMKKKYFFCGFVIFLVLFTLLVAYVGYIENKTIYFRDTSKEIYETEEIAYREMLKYYLIKEKEIISKFKDNGINYYVILTKSYEDYKKIKFFVVKTFEYEEGFSFFSKKGYKFSSTNKTEMNITNGEFHAGMIFEKDKYLSVWKLGTNEPTFENFEKIKEIDKSIINHDGINLNFAIYEIKEK